MYSSYYCIVSLVSMTIVLTGTLTCWRHASNDDVVRAGHAVRDLATLFHMYVLHCCLLSLHVHALVQHHAMKTQAHLTPFTAAPKQDRKWGASQLADTCRIHSSLVPAWRWMKILPIIWLSGLLRGKDQRSMVEMSGGFSSTLKLIPENCASHKTGATVTVVSAVWRDLQYISPLRQIVQHHNLQDLLHTPTPNTIKQFIHQDNTHMTFYLIIRIQVRWTPLQMS